ncbi:hypothetical protein BGZ97_002689 [Linnemannia gamsii]|uniref:Major facilitator superfamily (MFS) profile domain-containing protein n=1 Tax=Linnemannia gamsii TaxID=64522 RepID=A0A9P6RKA3_9FUNG|nr:hypothetical protein BGZ97_002689 [Linnemannia gamsii]
MENRTISKEEEAIGVEVKGGTFVDSTTPQPEEEHSNILERKYMTKSEFHWLWAGVLFQSLCQSFEGCLTQGIIGPVASYFEVTSLTAVLPTILAVLSTALVPFYTKVADVFGRAGSLTYAFSSYLMGLTIEGTARSFTQLAIGQIFYGMGLTGMQALSQVVIADTTSLLHRGIMFAMYDMGNVINIWTAQVLIDPLTKVNPGEPEDKWRTAYIIMGCISGFGALCLLVPLWRVQQNLRRRKVGQPPRRTLGWLNWEDPTIIGLFCSGIVFFFLLFTWEAKFATRPIMSTKIWTNRTAFACLMIMFLLKVLGNVVWQYLTQYFVVSRDLTFGQSYLLVRGFQMAWLVFQLVAAVIMKRWKKARVLVWVGLIIYVIGVGLMIPARSQDASVFLVVISQTIAGAGGGMANLASSVLVTGVVHKKDLATVVGASQIMVSFGSAVGNAVAGGIWTQYLPARLREHVTGPYDERRAMNDPLKYVKFLDPITKQQVINAYSDSQWFMSIMGLAVAALTLVCAAMIRHVNLEQDQDTQDRIALGEDVNEIENEKQEARN